MTYVHLAMGVSGEQSICLDHDGDEMARSL